MFTTIDSYAESLRKQHGTALLSKHQAARELSISRATLDRLRAAGQIRSQRVGSQVRFNVTEIARIVMGGAA